MGRLRPTGEVTSYARTLAQKGSLEGDIQVRDLMLICILGAGTSLASPPDKDKWVPSNFTEISGMGWGSGHSPNHPLGLQVGEMAHRAREGQSPLQEAAPSHPYFHPAFSIPTPG